MGLLFLGLASGAACLMFCGPVLLPVLMGEGKSTLKNYIYLGEFLIGRLLGYLLFGVLAWILGRYMIKIIDFKDLIYGIATIILSIMLFFYIFVKTKKACERGYYKNFVLKLNFKKYSHIVILMGFFTGISICPPFLLAFTQATNTSQLIKSIFSFFLFFIGTTVWFIPFPFIGFFKNVRWMTQVAQVLGILVSFYYFNVGLQELVIYFV